MCHSDKQGIYAEKNNALPTWRGAGGEKRYDAPFAPTDLTLAEKILIARLSVTATIHQLAHGGVASTGQVSEAGGPMAAVLPRLPADGTVIRVRRGAAASSSKKQNRLYAVRRKKVMCAPHWLNERDPYYADVVSDPSRLADIVEGAEIPGVKDMKPAGGRLPEDMGPAPTQEDPTRSPLASGYLRRLSRQGEFSSPK